MGGFKSNEVSSSLPVRSANTANTKEEINGESAGNSQAVDIEKTSKAPENDAKESRSESASDALNRINDVDNAHDRLGELNGMAGQTATNNLNPTTELNRNYLDKNIGNNTDTGNNRFQQNLTDLSKAPHIKRPTDVSFSCLAKGPLKITRKVFPN
ncbi:hypothetical protein AB6A40_002325 [Gnathostoma spinigerum]|uniref:Uncharacterized protein n=1 Tax=Gnathostoma spinigerum TaxID=75299 RepID=A0ABD6E8U5_9BILA